MNSFGCLESSDGKALEVHVWTRHTTARYPESARHCVMYCSRLTAALCVRVLGMLHRRGPNRPKQWFAICKPVCSSLCMLFITISAVHSSLHSCLSILLCIYRCTTIGASLSKPHPVRSLAGSAMFALYIRRHGSDVYVGMVVVVCIP